LGCWISPCYGPFSLGARFENYEPFISLIFQIFSGRGNPRLTETADTESADTAVRLYIFNHISFNSSWNEKCFRQKLYKKSRHILCSVTFIFSENRAVMRYAEKYCRAGQTSDDNMAHAHCLLDT